jgi:proton-translocating NADH-quinone oxidoreductase chain L
MNGDPHQGRFMSYLSLFTAFMLVLVTADNFVLMFFGWEGIGLASFLLIGFWHTRIQASKSAIKAMLVNRVGDVGLALGICLIFLTFKSVDYSVVFALVPCVINKSVTFLGFDFHALTIISFLLFWGVLGKSAQLSLHIWLPDAMEGPTPVSALIHAATLVVSGVFLIIRCSILFENSENVLFIVSIMGALTAFFAASVGLFQNDLKRVIAYSTCSQLGYMVFITGLSHYSVSLFHLANHAVFKALLFLSAGCIIHGLSDEQDLRKMGGLLNLFPVSYVMVLIGSLALVGFPFLTGFYSKDCILELAVAKHTIVGNFSYFLGCSAAFCTSFYSFRLVFLTFINPVNSYKNYIEHAHDAPITMVFPLIVLSLGAMFYGYLTRDLMIGLGSLFFNNVHTNYYNFCLIDSEFLPSLIKNIPFIFTCLGAGLSFALIHCFSVSKHAVMDFKLQPIPKALYTFLNKKWHFDQIVNELIVVKIMNFGYLTTFQSLDKGLIERVGPTGFTISTFSLSANYTLLNSGILYHTAFAIIFFTVLFLTFFVLGAFGLLTSFNASFILLFISYVLTFLSDLD